MDRHGVVARDVHHRRAVESGDDLADLVEPPFWRVHHNVPLVLRGQHRLAGGHELLDLRVRGVVWVGVEPDRRLQDLVDDGEPVHAEGGSGGGDVHDGVGHIHVRRELGRARDLHHVGVDALAIEVLAGDPGELGRDAAARQIRGRGDRAALGCGQHEPAPPERQVDQLRQVDAGLDDLIPAGDPDRGGAVADVLGDVGRAGEQDAHVGVDGVGVELPVGRALDREPGAFEEVDARLVETALVGHGDAHR